MSNRIIGRESVAPFLNILTYKVIDAAEWILWNAEFATFMGGIWKSKNRNFSNINQYTCYSSWHAVQKQSAPKLYNLQNLKTYDFKSCIVQNMHSMLEKPSRDYDAYKGAGTSSKSYCSAQKMYYPRQKHWYFVQNREYLHTLGFIIFFCLFTLIHLLCRFWGVTYMWTKNVTKEAWQCSTNKVNVLC